MELNQHTTPFADRMELLFRTDPFLKWVKFRTTSRINKGDMQWKQCQNVRVLGLQSFVNGISSGFATLSSS